MSTKDRKAREKEELKSLILKNAQKLFVEKGIEQTTIRNIADAIEYSVGTVYLYFKDKNAILHALHTQGFNQMGREFMVLHNVIHPMERLKAMGKVYINFALNNPDMYELMFTMKAPMQYLNDIDNEEWQEGKGTFSALKETIQDCLNQGYFKNHDLEPLSFMIWSVVHGMCSLSISNRIEGVRLQEPNSIVERGYQELLKILDKLSANDEL